MTRLVAAALALVLVAAAGPPASAAPAETSCTVCHSDAELFEEEDRAIVADWADGVHASVGLSCHDCHGGNPDPALAEDADAAMAEDDPDHPFLGLPAKGDIPGFCGRCHSDPEYMKRFRPDARIDQEREYWTSYHGVALAKGDPRVATCTDCHGVHGIRHAGDPRSAVYPTHVADTCAKCHADPKRMAGTLLPDGSPIPIDQAARWRASVHGEALMEKGDLYAPTCNDCHGNHGAAPPGVESVSFVCGRCHGREAELFRASSKSTGFTEHNDLLADEDVASCAACHEAPEPAAAITGVDHLGQCTACHGNHSVGRPTTALLAGLPSTPCALCHGEVGESASEVLEPAEAVQRFELQRDALLAEADSLGLQGEKRYDWLVDRARVLPAHTQTGEVDGEMRTVPRPEFGRLFEKFRVGKTHFAFTDPVTGKIREDRVRRCSDCHTGGGTGLQVAHDVMGRMQELQTRIARAERILLAAKRGGVEVGEAAAHLDEAVDSEIQLQVLLHSFAVGDGSPFVETHTAGLEQASAALGASEEALRELGVRRRGLHLSLVFIGLVLVGLALKIRDLSRSPA